MAKEKITDTSKQPQDLYAEERLSDNELDKIAGGTGENATDDDLTLESDTKILSWQSGPGGK